MAIRRGSDDGFRPDVSTGAGSIDYHDVLTPLLAHALCKEPRHLVGRPTRRKGNDHVDGTIREGLTMRAIGQQQCTKARDATVPHGVSSSLGDSAERKRQCPVVIGNIRLL
jgi:hypothetical protein